MTTLEYEARVEAMREKHRLEIKNRRPFRRENGVLSMAFMVIGIGLMGLGVVTGLLPVAFVGGGAAALAIALGS